MAAFLDVLLRGLALSGQAIAIGGVLFALLVRRDHGGDDARRRMWTIVAVGAAGVAGAVAAAAGVTALLAPDGALSCTPLVAITLKV